MQFRLNTKLLIKGNTDYCGERICDLFWTFGASSISVQLKYLLKVIHVC